MFYFGTSATAKYYVGYTYLKEIQPKEYQVVVSTTMFLFESLVYLFICFYFSTLSNNWKLLQIPNILFCGMGILYLSRMPESPRFFISNNRFTEARDVFKWIGVQNGIDEDQANQILKQIKFEGEQEKETE